MDAENAAVQNYYKKKKRRRRRRAVTFYALLLALVVVVAAVLSMTVFFNIENIEVEGCSKYTAQQIIEAGGVMEGQNLIRLDKGRIADGITSGLPYVLEVEINRRLPSTLVITVTETSARMYAMAGERAALLDSTLKVLELVDDVSDISLTFLSGVTLADAEAGYPAQFEGDVSTPLTSLIEAVDKHLNPSALGEINLANLNDIVLTYDNRRLTIYIGSTDNIMNKLAMAAHIISQNPKSEVANIDVENVERAIYQPVTLNASN